MSRRKKTNQAVLGLLVLGLALGTLSCGDDTPPAIFLRAIDSADLPKGTTHELVLHLTAPVMTKSYIDVTNPAPTNLEIESKIVVNEGLQQVTVSAKALELSTSLIEVVFSLRGSTSTQIWRVNVVDPNG